MGNCCNYLIIFVIVMDPKKIFVIAIENVDFSITITLNYCKKFNLYL